MANQVYGLGRPRGSGDGVFAWREEKETMIVPDVIRLDAAPVS